MIPKIIKSEAEYDSALEQLDLLMDAAAGSPEAEMLELWATLIDLYEQKAHPIELPSAIEAILFRMEQAGAEAERSGAAVGEQKQSFRSPLWQTNPQPGYDPQPAPRAWHSSRSVVAGTWGQAAAALGGG